MTPWLTVPQAAEVLQVSTDTIYELVRDGKIRHHRVGRIIRFTTEDLALYDQATQVHTPEASVGRSRPRRRRSA